MNSAITRLHNVICNSLSAMRGHTIGALGTNLPLSLVKMKT